MSAEKTIGLWLIDWAHGFRGTSPRYCLSHQLRIIRRAIGNDAAKAFAESVRSLAPNDVIRAKI